MLYSPLGMFQVLYMQVQVQVLQLQVQVQVLQLQEQVHAQVYVFSSLPMAHISGTPSHFLSALNPLFLPVSPQDLPLSALLTLSFHVSTKVGSPNLPMYVWYVWLLL